MSIFLRTDDPRALVSAFDGLLASKVVKAWIIDRYGNYFHDVPHWHDAAFFHPLTLGDGLRLNLHFIDKRCDRRSCFSAFHGTMVETMLHHCADRFFDIHVSREPAYGDEPFAA